MVVRMRHTRSHTANRRSHHALKRRALATTAEGSTHPRHRVVLDGGTYRGRTLPDLKALKSARRAARTSKTAGKKSAA